MLSWTAVLWQRRKDSNPHKRSQSPVCYLYTTPLNATAIIYIFFVLSTLFSSFTIQSRKHGEKQGTEAKIQEILFGDFYVYSVYFNSALCGNHQIFLAVYYSPFDEICVLRRQ